MQHRNMPSRPLWIVCVMAPGIHHLRCGMSDKVEHFYYAVPHNFVSENLFHWNATDVDGFRSVQVLNYVF